MPRPLRLLLFSHSAHFAGSEQLLFHLVRQLERDRDVRCAVVVPGEGPLAVALRGEGLDCRVWRTSPWCRGEPVDAARARRMLASGAAEVLGQLAAARAFDPDVVLSMTTTIPWGGLAALLLGRPHVWYVTDFGGAATRPPSYFLPFEEVRRALHAGADRHLVVSRAVGDRLFADAPRPPLLVYPHLPPPVAPPRAPAGAAGGPVVLAVFGAIRPAKGQGDAVAALAELVRRGLDAELVLVGHAPDGGREIEERAASLGLADRLRITGFVPDQHEWMAAADVVLVPSHEETFSLVCLEAQLHGRPLVATRVGGIPEVVEDGRTALLVPAGAPRRLADAVEALIRRPALARDLAEEGRRRAAERFTADRFSGAVRRVLDEVAAAGRRCAAPPGLLAPLEALAAERREMGRREPPPRPDGGGG